MTRRLNLRLVPTEVKDGFFGWLEMNRSFGGNTSPDWIRRAERNKNEGFWDPMIFILKKLIFGNSDRAKVGKDGQRL